MDERSTVLEDMIDIYGRTGASVVAFKSFPVEEMSSYGCADPEPTDDPTLVRLRGIVEKPEPADAPSNLAVMGRYPHPGHLDALDRTKPGVGGEIQLTDAIAILLAEQPVYGHVFTDGRFDIGKKLDYLRATVELALDRDDLGPGVRRVPGRADAPPRHRLSRDGRQRPARGLRACGPRRRRWAAWARRGPRRPGRGATGRPAPRRGRAARARRRTG